MENNIIKICFTQNDSYELGSNNPNIDGLMEFAIGIKGKFNIDDISVECKRSEFDKDGFAEILKKSFTAFFDELEINSKQLSNILNDIEIQE